MLYSWYFACTPVGTENTWSSSSSVNPLDSGRKNRIRTKRSAHHAAYHPNAPVLVKLLTSEGNVRDTMKLKVHVVAVARDMPSSRIYNG
jgi:hypothetical protein